MSDAPESIWINTSETREMGFYGGKYEFPGRIEYIRADIAQAQLAQAREQNRLLVLDVDDDQRQMVAMSDLVTNLRTELQQARERLAGAMEWVPIAEADLKDGEVVDIRNRRGTRFVNCTYRPDMEAFVNDVTAPSIVMAEFITHILRITPPTSAGGG